jgi:hypothetical protein
LPKRLSEYDEAFLKGALYAEGEMIKQFLAGAKNNKNLIDEAKALNDSGIGDPLMELLKLSNLYS